MADTEVLSADVDGVKINPPAGSPAEPGKTPVKTEAKGGQPTRLEAMIPAQTEEAYRARNQVDTGMSYAMEQRKFLNWLNVQGLHFGNMPAGSADKFLLETYPNPVTRQKGCTALTGMFTTAKAMGIEHIEQTITRPKREPKPKPEPHMMGVPTLPAAGSMPVQPPHGLYLPHLQQQPPVASSTAMQTVAPVEAPSAPAPTRPPQQQPQPKPHDTFPSLGKRIRVSKLADGSQFGIPPGHAITIGIYQKEQVEIDGSLENFLAFRIRPVHGPFPGQNPVVYRVEQLDTAMKPLPGQMWDVPIAADINGAPPQQAQSQNPNPGYLHPALPPPVPMPTPAQAQQTGNPSAVMERLLDRALAQAEKEQQEYERKRRELEERRSRGDINDMQMLWLMRDLQAPKPIDQAELRRQLRDELKNIEPQQVAPAPLPTGALGGLFNEPPKSDPTVERLMDTVQQLNQKIIELASAKPEKTDSLGDMEKLLMLAKALAPPPPPANPVLDQLAALSLRQLTEPQKPKTMVDLIQEMKMMKEATQLLGGGDGSSAPTLSEAIIEVIGAVSENADKLGAMFSSMKSGAVKAAFQKNKPQPKQLPAQVEQQQVVKPAETPYYAEQSTVQLFVEMVKTLDTEGVADEDMFTALTNVLENLLKEKDPRGRLIVEKVRGLFTAANTRIDLQEMVSRFFGWVGAKKLLNEARLAKLTDMLVTNYAGIYGLLNEGAQRELPETVEAQQPAETDASDAPIPNDASDTDSSSSDEEEEEDEDDDVEVDVDEPEEKAAANG